MKMTAEIKKTALNASHLYVHVPFCNKKCPYCDFYSIENGSDWHELYVEAVLRELKCSPLRKGQVDTLFVGGGTPTVLGPSLLTKLLKALGERTQAEAEITVEANPLTITREIAECLKDAFVNRVSLGVQSFDDGLRANLGRQGNEMSILSAIDNLCSAGFENISIDLLFGIPGQKMDDLKSDVNKALSLGPAHISYYELTPRRIGYKNRWDKELKHARKMNADFYTYVIDNLEQAGYIWYETSNFAKPGRQCRHNVAYWNKRDFLGLGAGAWSTVGQRRWMNVDDLKKYISLTGSSDEVGFEELISEKQIDWEYLILGLRQSAGVERQKVVGAIDRRQETVLIQNGLLANRDGKIFLTRKGRYLADEVCARLARC